MPFFLRRKRRRRKNRGTGLLKKLRSISEHFMRRGKKPLRPTKLIPEKERR